MSGSATFDDLAANYKCADDRDAAWAVRCIIHLQQVCDTLMDRLSDELSDAKASDDQARGGSVWHRFDSLDDLRRSGDARAGVGPSALGLIVTVG